MTTRVLVTGAGGFIGHHLVKYLKHRGGYWVRGVDLKHPEFESTTADQFEILDLRRRDETLQALRGNIHHVYGLAADMGGMGFISRYHAEILYNNGLINWNSIEISRLNEVDRYFFSSSACVYPEHKQTEIDSPPLREEDAYPAAPQDAYGWEKLMTEQLCEHYRKQFELETRIARFHNVYGHLGTWRGGREKAPAALCRKIAIAKLKNEPVIEVWGDGKAVRSYLFIDDCIEGIYRLMHSDCTDPLNLGQDEAISVNDFVQLISEVADYRVDIRHVEGPQGVRGRNSNNTRLEQTLNWRPTISLRSGIQRTYTWIEQQVRIAIQKGEL